MNENRMDSASNSQSSTSATGKQVPTSRLGRGLGSLIPAAPQQQFQQAALPATKPESDKSPSLAGTPVKVPPALNAPVAIQSPQTNPTIQSIELERSTGNIPVSAPAIPGTAVVEMNISFIARNSRQPREKFDDRAIQSLAESIRQHGLLQPVEIVAAELLESEIQGRDQA